MINNLTTIRQVCWLFVERSLRALEHGTINSNQNVKTTLQTLSWSSFSLPIRKCKNKAYQKQPEIAYPVRLSTGKLVETCVFPTFRFSNQTIRRKLESKSETSADRLQSHSGRPAVWSRDIHELPSPHSSLLQPSMPRSAFRHPALLSEFWWPLAPISRLVSYWTSTSGWNQTIPSEIQSNYLFEPRWKLGTTEKAENRIVFFGRPPHRRRGVQGIVHVQDLRRYICHLRGSNLIVIDQANKALQKDPTWNRATNVWSFGVVH